MCPFRRAGELAKRVALAAGPDFVVRESPRSVCRTGAEA